MPTYEYRCNACGIEFEIEKRMSDPVQTACVSCGAADTERLISHSSFVLKGSGWYLTDYARKNGSSAGNGGATKHESKVGESKSEESKSEESKAADSKTAESSPAPSAPASTGAAPAPATTTSHPTP